MLVLKGDCDILKTLKRFSVLEVEGTVEDIIYKNLENGYGVVNINFNGTLLTCVGTIGNLSEGEYVKFEGSYINTEKYGKQFSVKKIDVSSPDTLEGIERYLGSGLIKGIGPVTAAAIVDKFKLNTLEVIEFAPEKLAQVRGVSDNKAQVISSSFNEIKNMRKAVMFLQNYGISTNMSVKIYNIYQDKTISTISQNPYRLIEDVDGIGFLTADKIAKNMGILPESEFRLRAGILHCLKDASEKNGDTCLKFEDLKLSVKELLLIGENYEKLFELAIENLIITGGIKTVVVKGTNYIMLSKFYYLENNVAQKVNLMLLNSAMTDLSVDGEIKSFQELSNITLHEDQIAAIKMAINNSVGIITGGPGTGKTTIIKCILNVLQNITSKIYLVAPTGRAAKRLCESCGAEATTIHRALEVNFKDGEDNFFVYNEKNKLPAKVVIVDEVSMVDVSLMSSLIKALNNDCKLILVGDKDQLPSVGAGNVLHDLLESKIVPTTYLTQIYRQTEESLIIKNAHLINSGKMPEINNKSADFFFEEKKESADVLQTMIDLSVFRLPKFLKIEPNQIQVLSPMKSGVCGVDNLNRKLQEIINPESLHKKQITLDINIFRVGDKVMHIVNDYTLPFRRDNGRFVEKGQGVFNGEIGFITNISQNEEISVLFDDDKEVIYPRNLINEITIAYATTIHKSQGSEFDVVVMPLVAGSNKILTRNLLYTAVTRAKKVVVIVGTKQNMARMIFNNFTAKRYSLLKEFLLKQKANTEFLYG